MKRSPLVMMMCDASPAVADDGGQLVLEGTELKCIIPVAGARVVRLGEDQVAAGDQFVALDGGVVAKWPNGSRRRFWWSTGHKPKNGYPLIARLVLP
jgi:hypothetical protein